MKDKLLEEYVDRQTKIKNSLIELEDYVARMINAVDTMKVNGYYMSEMYKGVYNPNFYNTLNDEQKKYIDKLFPKEE
jgi:nitrogen regulatory protein PII-like uncharacterized protein